MVQEDFQDEDVPNSRSHRRGKTGGYKPMSEAASARLAKRGSEKTLRIQNTFERAEPEEPEEQEPTSHNSTNDGSSSGQQELKSNRLTRIAFRSKVFFYILLLMLAIAAAAFTYIYISKQENDEFENGVRYMKFCQRCFVVPDVFHSF